MGRAWSGTAGDRFGVELLRRVVAAGLADRWTLRDVAPRDSTRFITALNTLVDLEFVERVPVRLGVWYYRLTAAGVKAAEAGSLPARFDPACDVNRITPPRTAAGRARMERNRQRAQGQARGG